MISIVSFDKPKIAPSRIYTLSEYLAKEERSLHKHQFFNGQIIRMPGAKAKHNEIAANMTSVFKNAVRGIKPKFRVYNSDQKILIEDKNVVVYPDTLVICEKPIFWNGREDLIINPLVVVEVLSNSTRKYDRGEKFTLYKYCPTLIEYVLIEQIKPQIESWYRLGPTTWDNMIVSDINQTFTLRSLNIAIALSDVYEDVFE